MLDEELILAGQAYLEHFGTKGMKWGVRRGRGTTGLTRHRGALIDRNTRIISVNKGMVAGTRHKRITAIGKKIVGDEAWKRRMNTQVKELNAQNDRLRKGKLTVEDRLDAVLNVSVGALVVSRTPR